MPALAKPLQIFRAGTQTDASGRTLAFTAADLAATAAAYDPAKHEAPLVVGHPATNAPAYGWAEALTQADGALEATPHQVDAAFAEMVNSGRFKKISSSFWLPDAPGNPVPGVYYLRHIGFLGAAAPAVKGLRTPEFSGDAESIVTLEFSLPEPTMPDPTADFSAREAALAKAEAELKAKVDAQAAQFAEQEKVIKERAAALAKAEADAARKDALDFAEEHAKAGRILPRHKAGLAELLVTLPKAPLEFAEGGQVVKTLAPDWVKAFIASLPTQIDFTERSAAPQKAAGVSANFSAPAGYDVDADQMELHLKAKAYALTHKIDYAQAIAALTQ